MDYSVIVGIILGISAVVVGMIAKGASIAVLINPGAMIIIFVGTAAAIANAFTLKEIKRIPTLFKVLFTEQKLYDPASIIKLLEDLSRQVRKEGLLSLEANIEEINDPFIKKGLEMIVDGGALVFSQAGMYAPTLGVLGAVVGLIGALGNLDDTEKLGHSIAAAFVATLFGIFTGYVLWHPFANKLKRKSSEEVIIKNMILEGLIQILNGSNPMQLKQKMMAFLNPQDRARLEKMEMESEIQSNEEE